MEGGKKKSAVLTIGNGVYIAESQIPGSGNGLFTSVDIANRQKFTTYDGEIVSKSDLDERVKRGLLKPTHVKSLNQQHTSIIGLSEPDQSKVIGRGGGSYANDPLNPLIYNVKFTEPVFNEATASSKIYLEALRSIRAGEELFVRYGGGGKSFGIDYWASTGQEEPPVFLPKLKLLGYAQDQWEALVSKMKEKFTETGEKRKTKKQLEAEEKRRLQRMEIDEDMPELT